MCLNFALKHRSDHLGERKLKKKCSDFNLLGLLFRHFVVKNTTFYWIKDFLLVFSKNLNRCRNVIYTLISIYIHTHSKFRKNGHQKFRLVGRNIKDGHF